MQSMDVRVISGREVRELLPYPDCVNVIAGAMKAVSAGKAVMPLRQFMALPVGDGKLAWMPGYLGEPPCFGIKLLSLYPGNPAVGLSSHVGLYALYESSHGRPLVIMEASALTAVRTAAASVVATKALARKTGARGLRSIVEHVLLDIMYDLPSIEGLSKVVVDEKAINGDGKPLLIYAEQPKVAAART